MTLHRVAWIGATSRIGPAILDALAQLSPPFSTTILVRTTAKPVPSYPNTRLSIIPDFPTLADLKTALEGHDALVCALHPSTLELQLRLADACVAAGVRRYVLADYGSVESDDSVVAELISLFRNKTAVREYCQRLMEESEGRFSCTVAQVGRAVAGVLRKEDETNGKVLYVQSFCVSQVDILEAFEAVSRGKTLERIDIGADEYIEEMKREMQAGSYEALEQIVCVLGLTRALWEKKPNFANKLSGLQEEDMRGIADMIVGEIGEIKS
ncbi:MAG: hypothetical protein Q9157_001842 [Trypethelium eluteriae]